MDQTPGTSSVNALPTPPSYNVKGQTKQSKKMPYWLWYIIAKSLGIKLHPRDKPLLAIILHAITLFSGGGMFLTRIWFSGYDILSHETETDILDGMVSIIIATLFVSLGVYSQRLAHKLFEHPKVLEMMRLHSKTFAKMNVAILAILILAGFCAVLNMSNIEYAYRYSESIVNKTDVNPCQTVEVPLLICQVYFFSQAVYSLFFLLWNAMVGAALICVARTHTIAIRKFICQLECDAYLHDQKLRAKLYNRGSRESRDSLKSYTWENDTTDLMDQKDENKIVSMDIQDTPTAERNGSVPLDNDDDDVINSTFDSRVQLELNDDTVENAQNVEDGNGKRKSSLRKRFFGNFQRLSETTEGGEDDNSSINEENSIEPKILSDEELLHKYWKLVNATRLSSNAFQRWMCFVTVTVLFWSAIRIVYWLSHTPTLYGVFSLILPLFILPLLASAYAEVNYQGFQVFQSIIPTKERTSLFRYLYGTKIQLNVYGYPVTYGTMGTVLAAILAAFASRILLQEMNKVLN